MKYFRIQEFTLNLMGTFLEREKNTHLRRIQSWVNIILFPINLIPLITTTAFFYPDLTLMSDPIMLLIGIFISMCKLWPLHFGPRNFELLYDKVIKLGATMKIHEEPCVEKSVKFAKFVSKVNLFSLSISMTVFNLIPLVDPIYRTLKGEKDIFWPNAFNWHYPFDMSKNWVYITAYILAFYTFSQICIINNAVDTIFLESCLVGSSHFKILQRRIENVQFKSPGYDKDIIGLIGYHNEIHDLANIVTRAYQAGLFFYFTIASIMICIIFFELLMCTNVIKLLINIGFLATCFMQVFCYTYGGTELILESQNMVNAVYSSDWTAATPKQRKSLQIIMLRGQFICRIRVRLFEVSLVTLSKIFSSAFSYVALLRSVIQ